MNTRTELTLSLQGVTEKDGDVTLINNTEEHIEAIMAFTFRENGTDAHTLGMTALGGFSRKYFSEIIQHMIQVMGRDEFMSALMLAELLGRLEKQKENCGGGCDS